jgi:RNA polymerase sigma-70 factor (ECF subfamily)
MSEPSTTYLQQCLDRMNAGDATARNDLIYHAYESLRRLAGRLLRGSPEARRWMDEDDLLQLALLRLLDALQRVRVTSAAEFYRLAATLIRRELIDLARRHSASMRRADPAEREANDALACDPADEDSDFERQVQLAALHEHIQRLPEKERAVVDLLYYQGLTQAQAAEVLQLPEHTVRRRWARARERLREALDESAEADRHAVAEPAPVTPGRAVALLPARPPAPDSPPPGDSVDCAVFAPPEVARGEGVLIQVFAYATGHESEAAARAKEFDSTSARRGLTTLEVLIPRGQVLHFHLSLHGAEVPDATRQLTWQGRTASVQFAVTIPAARPAGSLLGTVLVSAAGVPVGRIDFKLVVLDAPRGAAPGEAVSVGQAAARFRKAFVSYAAQDRPEVLRRVQMLRPPLTDIEVFQDVLGLDPGEPFEAVLYRRIDECDIFLLFWSSNARKSKWVRREIRRARGRQGPDGEPPPTILPIIIEGPPPPPPPPELAHLHFNDYLLYLTR